MRLIGEGFTKLVKEKFILAHISKKNKKKLPCVVVFNFEFNEEHEKTKLGPPSGKKIFSKKKLNQKFVGSGFLEGLVLQIQFWA